MSIFTKIGLFFTHLFLGAQKSWEHLEPAVQNSLIHASGVMDIINRNMDLEAPLVIDIIKKTFPDLTEEKLTEGLAKIAASLKIIEANDSPDLPTLIDNIRKYLHVAYSVDQNVWANIVGTIARGLAIFLAPPATRFAAISALMEFAYQTFIKRSADIPVGGQK